MRRRIGRVRSASILSINAYKILGLCNADVNRDKERFVSALLKDVSLFDIGILSYATVA